MNRKVSIIIPIYKVEKYIHKCIESIIQQTYTNMEIILVDDGSPDLCPSICDDYALKDSRIKVIHKRNEGQAAARNDGMNIMTGDFFMFVDSDDYIHQRSIEYCIQLAEKHSADLIQFSYEKGSNDVFSSDPFNAKDNIKVYDNRTIFESPQNNVILWGKFFSSDIHNKIRIPEGMLNEDDASTWKFYYQSKKIIVSERKLYYYRENPNSTMAQLSKIPNIDYPMRAYHERISFFDYIQDKHLSDLSKWRYSKFLMLTIGNPLLSKSDKNILKSELKEIWKDVIRCKPVPSSNKILLLLTLVAPSLSLKLVRLIRK